MAIETGKSWGAGARAVTWGMLALTGLLGLAFLTQLNMIGRRHYGRWDMTDDKELGLADETVKATQALKRDVEIYLVGLMSPMQGDASVSTSYNMTRKILYEYGRYSDHLKIHEVVSDARQNSLMAELRLHFKNVQDNMIYLVTYLSKTDDGKPADPKLKEIPLRNGETYIGDPSTGKVLELRVETALTNALIELAGDDKKIVYFTTSHGETPRMPANPMMPAFVGATNYLSSRLNLEFRELPAFAVVPADCDVLLIGNPVGPFNSVEAQAIDEYLQKGGRLMVSATYPSPLTEMLRKHGIDISSDFLYNGRPDYMIKCVFTGNHEISRYQAGSGKEMVMGWVSSARRVKERLTVKVTDLVVANEDVMRVDRLTKEQAGKESVLSEERERPAVVIASEQTEGAPGARKFRIVAMGFPFYRDDVMTQDHDIQQFTLNAFKWLLARENQIALPPKASNRTPLKMNADTLRKLELASYWGFPALGVVLGLMAWGFRRK